MIPIRDTIRSRRFPWVNTAIIVANILIFLYEVSLGRQAALAQLAQVYGFVPAAQLHQLQEAPLSIDTWTPAVTAMFLHGGWFHLFGNMLYLWVFGDNVEDTLGRAKYLLFYLLAGIAGNMAHMFMNPTSTIPTIGASGAIAGVLGAYFVTFPGSRILSLVPIFVFITFMELPAVLFLFLWFAMQVLNGLASVGIPGNTVAWWAHIGGFVAGMVLVKMLRKI